MKTYVLGSNAARKLKGLFAGQGKVGSREVAPSKLAFDSEYANPFAVQLAQSEDGGNGAWLIWLPSDTLLMVGADTVDPTSELTAAQYYPPGWYVLDFLSSSDGGSVYLNVHQPKDGDPTANFTDEPDEPADGETVTPILVATTSVDSEAGERRVKQFVSSTVTIGGSAESAPLPWDVRENPNNPGSYQVFDPVAYVMVGGVTGTSANKKPLKVVATNKRAGEWNYAQLDTVDGVRGVYCVITATVSSSGEISYECQNDSPMAKASILSVCMATVTQVEDVDPETGEPVVKNVLKQVRRGAPSVVGLGMPDRASIALNDGRETEIKGFKSQPDEADVLASLLSRGDSEEEYAGSVLVRTTDENTGKHALVFIPIGKGIGGGGGTTGHSGPINVPTGEMRCNSASGYNIQQAYRVWTFENGLLKSVSNTDQWTTGLPTLEISTLPPS